MSICYFLANQYSEYGELFHVPYSVVGDWLVNLIE